MDSQDDTGAESEGYFCIRVSSTEVNRRRQHRTSTFSKEGYFCIRASSTEVNQRRQHRTSTFSKDHCLLSCKGVSDKSYSLASPLSAGLWGNCRFSTDGECMSLRSIRGLGGISGETKTQKAERVRRGVAAAIRHPNVQSVDAPTPTAKHTARATGGALWVYCR